MKQQFKTILKLTIGYSLAFCLAGAIPIMYIVHTNGNYCNPGVLEVNDKGELTSTMGDTYLDDREVEWLQTDLSLKDANNTFQFITSSEASAIPNHVEVEAGRVITSTGVYGTGVGMGYSRYYSKPFAMCVSDKDKDKVDLSDSFRFLVK
jgi:hypothetical protein